MPTVLPELATSSSKSPTSASTQDSSGRSSSRGSAAHSMSAPAIPLDLLRTVRIFVSDDGEIRGKLRPPFDLLLHSAADLLGAIPEQALQGAACSACSSDIGPRQFAQIASVR